VLQLDVFWQGQAMLVRVCRHRRRRTSTSWRTQQLHQRLHWASAAAAAAALWHRTQWYHSDVDERLCKMLSTSQKSTPVSTNDRSLAYCILLRQYSTS